MLLSKVIRPFCGINMHKNIICNGSSKITRSFEDAILALNSLQTNSAALSMSIKMKQQSTHDETNSNLRDTEKYLERIDGFDMKSLDGLSVIHVSGSKGKGSVCTYTEAILREHNVKTGLFTSPHLRSVCERIKLMGIPIDKFTFNKYFWEVFDALNEKKSHKNDLPSYFKFLQIMAFYIFVKEKVDVAIVEVGIGGQYDSTNILRNTEIVGIAALQLEHTQLLGSTLEDIAWQKAGIIKENSDVFYMKHSEECVNRMIKTRFKELKGKRLSDVPQFDEYSWQNCTAPDLKEPSDINKINVSLSLQLSGKWLKSRNILSDKYFKDDLLLVIDDKIAKAIRNFSFEGRFQKIERNGVEFFLDGAHTKDSMIITSKWFSSCTHENSINVLLFNVTGDRNSVQILEPLLSINIDLVCFTTNMLCDETCKYYENYTETNKSTQFDRCLRHKEIFSEMCDAKLDKTPKIECFQSIHKAINYIYSIKNNNVIRFNVLVTGSLHLVGGVLNIIKNDSECLETL